MIHLSTSCSSCKQTESSVNSTPRLVTNKQVMDKSTITPKPPQIIAEKKFNLIIILWLYQLPLILKEQLSAAWYPEYLVIIIYYWFLTHITFDLGFPYIWRKFSASKPLPWPVLVKFLCIFEVEYSLFKGTFWNTQFP